MHYKNIGSNALYSIHQKIDRIAPEAINAVNSVIMRVHLNFWRQLYLYNCQTGKKLSAVISAVMNTGLNLKICHWLATIDYRWLLYLQNKSAATIIVSWRHCFVHFIDKVGLKCCLFLCTSVLFCYLFRRRPSYVYVYSHYITRQLYLTGPWLGQGNKKCNKGSIRKFWVSFGFEDSMVLNSTGISKQPLLSSSKYKKEGLHWNQ